MLGVCVGGTMAALLARAGFAAAFGSCLITLWIVCHFIQAVTALVGWKSKRERDALCVRAAQFCFYYLMIRPCPWIRLSGDKELQASFKEAAGLGTPYVLANHNSMLDSLLVTALLPPAISSQMRSLIKLALFSEPLFGYICTAVGHFPVFYKGSKTGDFSVDREAQAKVTAELDEFIGSNGGLVIFPEGQLNATPRQLQSFRRGAFALPMKHKRPIWALVNAGCETTWPKGQVMGGWPAKVHVNFFKVCDDASQFEDTTALAEYAQNAMQRELDNAYAIVDGVKKSS